MPKRYPVKCWVTRDKRGIKLRIEVIPEIEEFFKKWGGGLEEGPIAGRLWKPIANDKPLKFWSFEMDTDENPVADGLKKTGRALSERGERTINISFLRMVGASEPGGQEFIIETPMSTAEIERISSQIVKAATQFYQEFIRPVNIHCYVGIADYSGVPPAKEDSL